MNLKELQEKHNKLIKKRSKIGKKNAKNFTIFAKTAKLRVHKPAIPILQIDIKTGKVIARYTSTYEAAEVLSLTNNISFHNAKTGIYNCLNDRIKHSQGFKWERTY